MFMLVALHQLKTTFSCTEDRGSGSGKEEFAFWFTQLAVTAQGNQQLL